MRRTTIVLLVLSVCGLSSKAFGAIVVGGSTLLSGADADQLEAWLGEGPITLTNIFSKVTGDGKTSYDFHAAADGMGRTFSVIQVEPPDGNNNTILQTEIIGGYNPQSWDSYEGWHFSYTDAERTAFLFNLFSLEKQSQRLVDDPYNTGLYQTFNEAQNGPTFGGGSDLYIDLSLEYYGFANNYSYGPTILTDNITTGGGSLAEFTISGIEIFTISAAAAVPEPASLAVWSLLGLTIGGASRWRRKR